jgi:hypothetical protein
VRAAFIVTLSVLVVAVLSPVQFIQVQPVAGVAVSVTTVPLK